jgi:spore maturation protein CgeB
MRILYVAMKHDYGKPERGLSFEQTNFHPALLGMGHDLLQFDFMGIERVLGRDGMNRRLAEIATSERCDLLFCVLYEDQFDPATIRAITASGLPTLNWFCDDHWRFESYSSKWCREFTNVVTTDLAAVEKYRAIGAANAIKSQWACNHHQYRPLGLPKTHDATFVGIKYGEREHYVTALRRAGIDVKVWGRGWDGGRASADEMIRIFNQSCICLNFSRASKPVKVEGAGFARAAGKALRKITPLKPWRTAMKEWGLHYPRQIKGRDFEVPGCGSAIATGELAELSGYFVPGEEIITYRDADHLVEQVRRYLRDDDARERIARAGHARVMREHTYAHRFEAIFREMKLPSHDAAAVVAGKVAPGTSVELS